MNHIDSGKLIIVCLNVSTISVDLSKDSAFGRPYEGEFGHFIVIKGYWVLDGKVYFEVYDPNLPIYYHNNITGNNHTRYYDALEVINSAFNHNREVVLVSK